MSTTDQRIIRKMIKSLERLYGITAKIEQTVDVGTDIKIGNIYEITVDEYGVTAVHIPTQTVFKIYTGPVDKPKINFINKDVNPAIATGGTIPDTYEPVSISAKFPFDSVYPVKFIVSVSGIDTTNSESITVYIDLVHEDGTATRIPVTFTADGSTTISLSDVIDNLPDDKGIVGINISAVTSLDTTNATVTVGIRGIMV